MGADADLRGHDLERFRDYLAMLARLRVSPRYRAKIDLSGVVQQTLVEAWRAGEKLQEYSSAHRVAWLRNALAHNLADAMRKLGTAKRNIAQERSLADALTQSSVRMEALLVSPQSSPSQQVVKQEMLLRLPEALAQLPENQRRAVEMHHLQGRTLVEVAEELGCSKPAVAGLVHRGLKKLREVLDTDQE
jgi:RNA polymerase sigma-70 factor (ECF subfamily)